MRHFGLTMLVLLAPLPGMALVLLVVPFWTITGIRLALVAYIMSVGVGLLLAGEFALLVCEGTDRWAALRTTYRRRGGALSAASLAVAVILATAGMVDGAWPLVLPAALLTAVANGSALCFFYFARILPCREDFVARFNRAEERWHRRGDWLSAVARPRWGHTVAGIALVFAAVGLFGAQPLKTGWPAGSGAWIALPLMAIVALAALGEAIHDWRVTLAEAFALPVPILLGLWGLVKAGTVLNCENLLMLLLAVGAGAVSLFAAGADTARRSRTGDDTAFAARRNLQRDGRGQLFAGVTSALALLMSAPVTGTVGIALAVAAGSAGVGALLFGPAFVVVIEYWLPRGPTPASRYRLP